MKPINLEVYLKQIKVNQKALSTLSATEKRAYLWEVYSCHIMRYPYTNFELRKIASQHPIQRRPLSFFSYENLLSPKQGGYCFQSAALLADALSQLGYEVSFCEARILLGAEVNAKEILELPPTHLVLVVTIENKKFLLDPGLGSSAPRYPILITGSDEIIQQDGDQFKLHFTQNLYILERKSSQGWFRLTQSDLVPLDQKKAQFNLLKLAFHPNDIPIRDLKTVVGIITKSGRKSLIWDIHSNELKYTEQDGDKHQQEILSSFEEGYNKLVKEFNIHHISAEMLEVCCSKIHQPSPIEPWTVDFPLDESELERMELNLSV
ncbi:arylamine N-acetyltransferase [Legionella hackeliae]|uniref:Putative N-hydroxyarylamine O-acetyltransferase n=1 Tax=Legionella hackeliae TaxID=449 RepID=A0A0A8UNI1_LEGHA|nr:arylamine N-acetyltransferase [Legionella hackeliae]KTD13737.1 putative N-hydroxyarylamine O-acetyltransferase [Legionella hackeliae]CEK10435.1 putative N-hydroxyarylamine O-acetyltransferase [Legionella hackeliae]STX47171.1 putative N-hydroxyarylamine O-acetyltransferase [Legionella hackeliae]